jgi:endonuclease/exonuclease/phosphatase family metal-dependent hydrolase
LKPKRFLLVGAALILMTLTGCRERVADFTVMSFNIGDSDYDFPKADEVAAVVEQAGRPDVLLLQEVRGQAEVRQLGRRLDYDHYAAMPYKGRPATYIAILSRWPLEDVERLYFKHAENGTGALAATVVTGGRRLRVCSTHLDQIKYKQRSRSGYVDQSVERTGRQVWREVFYENARSKSARELLDWLAAKPAAAVVVGGDFNTIPLSKTARRMQRVYDDALWPSRDYFAGTYFKVTAPVLPRVDYIFHSAELKPVGAAVIAQTPGDHYPVRSGFCWR